MTLVLAALQSMAQDPVLQETWTSDDYTVSVYNVQVGPTDNYQRLVVNSPGALAAFIAATNGSALTTADSQGRRVNLQIEGELNAEDFTALNSSTESLAKYTSLDLKDATVAEINVMTSMQMENLKYVRLPQNISSSEDMKKLQTKNTNLDLVVSIGVDQETSLNKASIHSFTANSVLAASDVFKNGYNGFEDLKNCKYVAMSGTYGDKDLVNGTTKNFGEPAIWDFTGATFATCKIPAYTFVQGTELGDKHHYDIDDPFKETEGYTSLPNNYSTNAFYYFQSYAPAVVDIKLPTGIDTLPPACLKDLGSLNKTNYMAANGMTDDQFKTKYGNDATFAPIDNLVIPNNYIYLDHECGLWAKITNLVIGNGVKEIRGGAFVNSTTLENLDFAAGISDCYIGNLAFGECKSMKHIALAEGIVSLGANAFSNSQHLESIRLPETLLYIGNEAFNNCLALNSITIPSNVEKIGQQAFCLCPFTDIYLTTTDPDKIPLMWSAGLYGDNSGGSFDGRASFNHGHFDGWEGFSDNFGGIVQGMSWEEAAQWYYLHVNGLPVLHYPQQLADKVKAIISSNYDARSAEGYGLPANRLDMSSRSADQIMANYQDVTDLVDSEGKGQYTQNGWAQFVLMKEYVPGNEDIVYTKEYSDVWYTMCFPFDLTDEQLAAAFNETFNIADFSGVQVVEKTEADPMKLVLHFNKVAVTYYKDTNDKVYYRLCDDGSTVYRGEPRQTVWRERHGNFSYNVYVDPDDPSKIYHHVDANDKLVGNKTKTFALGNSLEQAAANKDNAIIIDGILAEAGHPYMIHPAIGVNPGQPKKACNMAGITWKDSPTEKERASSDCNLPDKPSVDEYRDWLYNHMARTVDLGNKSTQQEKWDNYDQEDYTSLGYSGNTYTFKGNPRDFKDGWKDDTSLPPRPTDESLVEPKAPQNPNPKPKAPKKKLSAPEQVTNPDDKAKYADVKELFKTERLTWSGWTGSATATITYTYGEDLANYEMSEFFTNWGTYAYATQSQAHNCNINNSDGLNAFKTYLGGEPIPSDIESRFAALKSLAIDYQAELDAFNGYDVLYEQYRENKALWDAYDEAMAEWNSWVAPADEQAAYNTAYAAWQTAVTNYNTWKTAMGDKGYNVVIPQYAYFLGTPAGAIYPKYFRQRSDKQDRSTGLWTQYSAIILPNATALAGLETDLGGVTSSSGTGSTPGAKSHDIAFDEDYFFINDTPQGIATLIEKIEKEEGKAPEVEYMDIVVSIDGKIVSRDKTTFEGLPKGVYIINGKKYYVK